jgi:hypothetical protein
MTMPDGEILELDALASAAVDGRLDAAGRARLEQRLRESEAARRHYVRLMGLSADLAAVAAESQASDGSSSAVRRVVRVRRLGARLALLAAAALLVASVGVAFWLVGTPPPEPTSSAVAVLTKTAEAEWVDAAGAPRPGDALPPGRLRLRSGLAQVEFHSGARVLLEGPSEFELVSPGEALCRSGRLVVEVPRQGRGFRLATPQATVVDRGTSFGLSVGADAEVHVFQGRVEVSEDGSGPVQDVKSGEAVAVDSGGAVRRFPASPAAFVFPADLEGKSAEAMRSRRAAWLKAGARINADSALLARFDFEGLASGDGVLRNVAASGTAAGDGSIVGCERADGRWPGKGALEFRSVSDRVRVEIPGEHRSLTLAAWVRVHGLDRAFNALFMCEGFEKGEVHWQIQNSGGIDLGLSNIHIYVSPVAFGPERFGQWTHVASVIDRDAGHVTHYINGARIDSAPIRTDVPLRIGPADLGNWTLGSFRNGAPLRHFSGRMDEFVLLARAADREEIRRMYEEGRP